MQNKKTILMKVFKILEYKIDKKSNFVNFLYLMTNVQPNSCKYSDLYDI